MAIFAGENVGLVLTKQRCGCWVLLEASSRVNGKKTAGVLIHQKDDVNNWQGKLMMMVWRQGGFID